MQNLTKALMLRALEELDHTISQKVTLIVGGGGAMILAHKFPLATSDIDAIPIGMEFHELDPHVKTVAKKLGIAPDWLNPWFSSFAYTLPQDYSTRLIKIFDGQFVTAQALGSTDLFIMKCFAHRQKDIGHAKALLKKDVDLKLVKKHIESLEQKEIPNATEALEFIDDLEDQL